MSPKHPIEVDKFVGAMIKARRIEVKRSQSDLASGLGITFQQVQKYERGSNRLTVGRLCQISQLLNVKESYFFPVSADDPELTIKNIVARFTQSQEAIALVHDYLSIEDPRIRTKIRELTKLMAATVDNDEPSEDGHEV